MPALGSEADKAEPKKLACLRLQKCRKGPSRLGEIEKLRAVLGCWFWDLRVGEKGIMKLYMMNHAPADRKLRLVGEKHP